MFGNEVVPTLGQSHSKTILVVEADRYISTLLCMVLSIETPYLIQSVPDVVEALKVIEERRLNLCIMDDDSPYIDGITLYDTIHITKRLEAIPTIMLSTHFPVLEIAQREVVVMKKPFELDELLDTIEKLIA